MAFGANKFLIVFLILISIRFSCVRLCGADGRKRAAVPFVASDNKIFGFQFRTIRLQEAYQLELEIYLGYYSRQNWFIIILNQTATAAFEIGANSSFNANRCNHSTMNCSPRMFSGNWLIIRCETTTSAFEIGAQFNCFKLGTGFTRSRVIDVLF